MFRPIARFIFYRIIGWKFTGNFPDLKKYIIIVAPHTSNWDFPMGLLARSISQIKGTKFLGKAELFRFPFGWIFRGMGGYPVNRSKNTNMVDAVVDIFNSHEKFKLALAPEGTRKKVSKLKTGFYHIAKKADVPIIMVGFDYKLKEIKIREPFKVTDDMEKDMKDITNWFRTIHAKIEEYSIG